MNNTASKGVFVPSNKRAKYILDILWLLQTLAFYLTLRCKLTFLCCFVPHSKKISIFPVHCGFYKFKDLIIIYLKVE
jgi:hypothetical protein